MRKESEVEGWSWVDLWFCSWPHLQEVVAGYDPVAGTVEPGLVGPDAGI